MGLLVNATVATGAKPKNIRIFWANSGSVENAMNAGTRDREGRNVSTSQSFKIRACSEQSQSFKIRVCSEHGTYGGPLRVSNVEDLFLSGDLQDVVYSRRKVLQRHLIVATDRK